MRIKFIGILIIVCATSCDFLNCNYDRLTDKEYAKIAELNRNLQRIDTLYNDKCLKGFVHVYLKNKSTDSQTEEEIEKVLVELKNENMERDIWVFNNQKEFVYRLFYRQSNSDDSFLKTELQYPNE